MAVQFAAQAGDGLVQGAIAKFIVFGGTAGFDLETAPPGKLLGMVLLVFVPYTFLSPFLGVVIDRWERRRLLTSHCPCFLKILDGFGDEVLST